MILTGLWLTWMRLTIVSINMRRTKIVCTVGPASESAEMLRKLVEAGTDVFRLNFSHGTVAGHRSVIRSIRAVADEVGKPVAILQDLPGPKIRLGVFKDGAVELHAGNRFRLTAEDVTGDQEHASVNYAELPQEVMPEQSILVADGTVELKVESVAPPDIVCRVVLGGTLTSHKGLSVIGGTSNLRAFTARDQELVVSGIEGGVDLVALSFVRAPMDIQSAQSFLAARQSKLPVMAKIEKLDSLDAIDQIIAVADPIMVARGDLGIEVPIAQVPHIQKELIAKANEAAKPVVTATQMLRSMVENPRPTRAEVADVFNAVLDGSDAVMLSEESAVGAYPVEAVNVLAETAETAEARLFNLRPAASISEAGRASASEGIARAAYLVALQTGAAAIICCTRTGRTARLVAKYRPVQPIIAVTPDARIVRQLMIVRGVQPMLSEEFTSIGAMLNAAIRLTFEKGIVTREDKIVVVAGAPSTPPGENDFLRVTSAEQFLARESVKR
jgi:pyruvate kinase